MSFILLVSSWHIAFQPQQDTLFSSGGSGLIRINARTGERIGVLKPVNDSFIQAIAFVLI